MLTATIFDIKRNVFMRPIERTESSLLIDANYYKIIKFIKQNYPSAKTPTPHRAKTAEGFCISHLLFTNNIVIWGDFMCTAIGFKNGDFYFGRTLDYEFSYLEEVVITPRSYPFLFRNTAVLSSHFALIGMAYVVDGYPLYYDAVNECGLCMAGLNFVGNANFTQPTHGKTNVAVFEFIPFILGKCSCVKDAEQLLLNLNLTDVAFNSELPTAQLHWIIADKNKSITVEATACGLKVYDNPVGVLTNNPPFSEQLFGLNNYMALSSKQPVNTFCGDLPLTAYSRGMGALGLPGDWSSQSRFVRAAFVKCNSVCEASESASVGQFFHILGSVNQVKGCCICENGKHEITIYTCCINADKGIYYYTTYENRQITAVSLRTEDLDSKTLKRFSLIKKQQIKFEN